MMDGISKEIVTNAQGFEEEQDSFALSTFTLTLAPELSGADKTVGRDERPND